MTAPVRVGLVDDQPLIRTGLRTMLEYASDLEIVGEAENGSWRSSWPGASAPTSS
jgi:DNA-binding NarL/FixJ family response regulator